VNDVTSQVESGGHRTIALEKSLFARNSVLAEQNRALFRERRLFVLNFVSAPGAGKTALLERLLDDLGRRWRVGVVVADLATDTDAQRLGGRGGPVVQVTTGTLCHLDAGMLRRAIDHLPAHALDVLAVENVGNLVCPAGYDLGESRRVVVAATTEGEDKPLKYPTIYHSADVVLLNKVDVVDAVGFDLCRSRAWISAAAPKAALFAVSARTGDGIADWHCYLDRAIRDDRNG